MIASALLWQKPRIPKIFTVVTARFYRSVVHLASKLHSRRHCAVKTRLNNSQHLKHVLCFKKVEYVLKSREYFCHFCWFIACWMVDWFYAPFLSLSFG